ncbi:NlpC/P60 family protein [Streptomyces fagopyri]|uniref:C40 family peptidase n=1 Tax=Streptomyces fagopyri TaxID=2662397 RepID=UPI0037237F77
MSGRVLRLVCTVAVATGALLAPVPAAAALGPGPAASTAAVPDPGPSASLGAAPAPGSPASVGAVAGAGPSGSVEAGAGGPEARSTARMLTNLQKLYRDAERATETYNATAEKLRRQRAEVARLDGRLAGARLSLHDSRGAAGRLARQQYQSSSGVSSYVRLLLTRDPQRALGEEQVIRQLSRERVKAVDRLAGSERHTEGLARRARKALDDQLTLAERQKKERDEVRARLKDVEKLLASLTARQLAELDALEKRGTETAQRKLVTSGALSSVRAPSPEGRAAVEYAVRQLGKPYRWGAEGPAAYDCSGLTSQAWDHAGQPIPRTSQEQWARLPRIPLTELRPGDLVVYFPEATHVALYMGDGMVVQAPRPGAKIKISPIAANPVLGAVRPDPAGRSVPRYTPPALPAGATAGPDGSAR